MAYLADTNIIARWVQTGDPLYPITRNAILSLHDSGETIYITPQVLMEFWAPATRPSDANGFGMTIAQIVPRVRLVLRRFTLLFNGSHFRRFPGITVVDPASL